MLSRAQKIFFSIIALIAVGFLILFVRFAKEAPEKRNVTLTIWGVEDDSTDLEGIIMDFQEYLSRIPEYVYTTVEVKYQKWRKDEIEDLLVNQLAEGKGPDIFYIHNTWLRKHIGKITPMPEYLMTADEFRKTFVKVAADDFIRDDKIYAVPHYVDTLALYYNINHYQSADLSSSHPAETWTGIQDDVRNLTIRSGLSSVIERAGIALGTANISNATDILYLMFLQHNSDLCYENCSRIDLYNGGAGSPEIAWNLFAGFSSTEQPEFTWSDDLLATFDLYSDVDAFAQGKVSMILGYSDLYQEIKVRAKDTRLQFDVVEIPQTDSMASKGLKTAFASYWAPTVSRTSKNPDVAWEFINFMTSKENLNRYHSLTKHPASREDLIALHGTEPGYKVFAKQAKYASSLSVYDKFGTDELVNELINKVDQNLISISEAIDLLEEELNKSLEARQIMVEEKSETTVKEK